MQASNGFIVLCDRQRTSVRETAGDLVTVRYNWRVNVVHRAAGRLGDHEVKCMITMVCRDPNVLHEVKGT
jgi:hypothetical protein